MPRVQGGNIVVTAYLSCDSGQAGSSDFSGHLEFKAPNGNWTQNGLPQSTSQIPPATGSSPLTLQFSTYCMTGVWQGYASYDVSFPGQATDASGKSNSPVATISKC